MIERFRTDRLVPTDEGKYAAATDVFQGPTPLREVVTPPELSFLSESQAACWAKGVSPNTRPEQFLRSLGINPWGWAELETALDSKYGGYLYRPTTAEDAVWLADRPDEWLQRLYILLGDALARDESRERALQRCRIVRVLENKDVNHVAGTRAYFPKARSYRDLPQIKPAILRGKTKQQEKKIEDGLVSLGVRQIGEEERIELVLATYYGEGSPQLARQQHLDHMRLFIKWWKREGSARKVQSQSIFRIAGRDQMADPDSCYLDTPIKTTGLNVIYRKPRQGIPEKYRLWAQYKGLNNNGFCDFAIACGVAATLPVDQDYFIPELTTLLRLQDVEVSRLIWDTVRKADPTVLEARSRRNKGEKSSLVLILAALRWIPDKTGTFHKPAEMTREKLHSSFTFDDRNGWLRAIGFEENAKKATDDYRKKQEAAKALGVSMEIVDQLNDFTPEERGELQAQFTVFLRRRARAKALAQSRPQESIPFHQALTDTFKQGGKGQTSQLPPPTGGSRNPGRRIATLESEIAQDIANEPSPETRFTFGICKKWKGKNDTVRKKLLLWYKGQCQICDKSFPQRNGEPYFEGLYLVPYTRAEWSDRPGNVLCLCPWHSAMFQFGSKQVDTDIASDVLGVTPKAAGGNGQAAIDMTLCGTAERIKFHEDHFLELKVMIQESQKSGADKPPVKRRKGGLARPSGGEAATR